MDTFRCPSCGHENRTGARFCEFCGARVAEPAAHRAGAAEPLGAASAAPVRAARAGAEAASAPREALIDGRPWWSDRRAAGGDPAPAWSSDGDRWLPPEDPLPRTGAAAEDPATRTPDPVASSTLPGERWAVAPGGWARASRPGGAAVPSSSASRLWAVGAHAGALVGAVAGGLPAFVAPLVVWLVRKDTDPFAAQHGRNALNFNLSVLAYGFGLAMLTGLTFGLTALVTVPAFLLGAFGWFVLTLVGAAKAAANEPFHYPFTIPFVGGPRPRATAAPPRPAPQAPEGYPRRPTAPVVARRERAAPAVGIDAARVARIRRLADQIAKPAARRQALGLATTAERILFALAEDGHRLPDAQLARTFLDRHLTTTETILERYVRLSARGVLSAEATLTKVEEHDLPLLARKLTDLYERLHRGDVIDLETASEMLDLDLAGPPARAAAASATG